MQSQLRYYVLYYDYAGSCFHAANLNSPKTRVANNSEHADGAVA
jgi:hypothetical protein